MFFPCFKWFPLFPLLVCFMFVSALYFFQNVFLLFDCLCCVFCTILILLFCSFMVSHWFRNCFAIYFNVFLVCLFVYCPMLIHCFVFCIVFGNVFSSFIHYVCFVYYIQLIVLYCVSICLA